MGLDEERARDIYSEGLTVGMELGRGMKPIGADVFEAKYKALSLTQPMAWAVFHGKDIENRNWNTKFRGRCYVHASKKLDKEHYSWIAQNRNNLCLQLPQPEDLVFGAIIGEVTIVSVVKMHTSRWFFGRYGFVLRDALEYEKPIYCKGALNFFTPTLKGG